MSNEVVSLPKAGVMSLVGSAHLSAIEHALALNDLSKLKTEERISYYNAVCESVGLNPLTQPFAYIVLDGRLTLYAKKECSEQLRKLNLISTQILEKIETEDFYEVHVRASDNTGRVEEDFASVYLYDKYGKKLTGMNLANAKMKCATKAKRRATLAISGLGLPDETELETIPNVRTVENPQIQSPFKKEEILENKQEQTQEVVEQIEPSSHESQSIDQYVMIRGLKKGKKLSELTVEDCDKYISFFTRPSDEKSKVEEWKKQLTSL